MSFQDYVKVVLDLGFEKATIINRQTYQTLALSSNDAIATLWTEKKLDDKEQEVQVQINENQELLNDWRKDTDANGKEIPRKSFCFYGQRYPIVLRDDEEGNWICCVKGKEVLIAYKFKTIYFIVYGHIKAKGGKKDEVAKGFNGAPDAVNVIFKNVFDKFIEAGNI